MCQQQAPPPRVPFGVKVAVVVIALMVANGGMERLPAQAAGLFAGVLGGLPGGGGAGVRPSREAVGGIPANYRTLYRQAGARYRVPWTILAGIGKVESNHGRSRAPGVRSGVNRFGCCAGPMQFNLRNGPPSTWDRYGKGSPYNPADAIPAAARLLVANGAHRSVDRAIYGYNHSWSYVAAVKSWARRYGGS